MCRPIRLALVVATLALVACRSDQNAGSSPESPDAGGYVECVVPRPQMCTKEVRPVCGLRDTGVRCVTTPCPSLERKTYGNACDACADGKVIGWRPGECAQEGIVEDG